VRVGRIPYLNSEPFYFTLEGTSSCRFRRARSGRRWRRRVDAAHSRWWTSSGWSRPSGRCARHRHKRSGAKRDPLLARPPKELDGAVVGVTDETRLRGDFFACSSPQRYRWAPQAWVDAASPSDAVLLIGDQALRALHGGHPAPYRIDVGTEWVEWTGLPCVFARWGVRASLGAPAAAELADALEASISDALASLRRIAMVRRDVGLDETGVQHYLRGFTYRLAPTRSARSRSSAAGWSRGREPPRGYRARRPSGSGSRAVGDSTARTASICSPPHRCLSSARSPTPRAFRRLPSRR